MGAEQSSSTAGQQSGDQSSPPRDQHVEGKREVDSTGEETDTLEDFPEDCYDTFSFAVMRDPVIISCGHTFERHGIQAWIASKVVHEEDATCPICRAQLNPEEHPVSNFALRGVIDHLVKNRPQRAMLIPEARTEEEWKQIVTHYEKELNKMADELKVMRRSLESQTFRVPKAGKEYKPFLLGCVKPSAIVKQMKFRLTPHFVQSDDELFWNAVSEKAAEVLRGPHTLTTNEFNKTASQPASNGNTYSIHVRFTTEVKRSPTTLRYWEYHLEYTPTIVSSPPSSPS